MKRIEQAGLREQAAKVTLVAFDVDGIMTDGALHFLPNGQEVKMFNTLDGLGIKLLQSAGIETAIITGRSSPQVNIRAKSLGFNYVIQGEEQKLSALENIWQASQHSAATTAYIGDDLPDLSAIRHVALGATVPNGHTLVKEHADWCTELKGGYGAVREFCEAILDCQDRLNSCYQRFM